MYRLFRSRPVRAGLVWLAIMVPLCVLFWLQWRSLDSFEAASAQVLKQGSRALAEQVAARIQRDFKSPAFNVLERVDHNDVRELRLDTIAARLNDLQRNEPLLDTFFLWSSVAPSGGGRDVLFFTAEGHAGAPAEMNRFTEDPALSQLVLDRSREFASIHANFALAEITYQSRTYEVVYHFLYALPERSELQSFLGFMVDSAWLRDAYFKSVVGSDEVTRRQLAGFSPLLVSIVDDRDQEVFRSGRSLLGEYEDEVRFPYLFYDVDIVESLAPFRPTLRYWRVRTAFEDGSIAAIVRGQTNRQRLLWLIVAFVAAAGVALSARAAIREVRLAEMKSDFVASVSHELKTPLAKIQLFADTLKSGRVRSPEKLQEYAEIISSQAIKLSLQIARILDFGRIEAGRDRYEMEEIDVRAVLSSALRSFEHQLSQNDFDVKLDVPEVEVPLNGNAEKLQQVFENLITNAMKYSESTHRLHVKLHQVNGHVRVDFTDGGIGIAKHDQRKIFRKFYRGRQPRSKAVTGSGLGLAIVDQIVRAHGGRVTVDSAPGQGSTFAVILPAHSEADRGRAS